MTRGTTRTVLLIAGMQGNRCRELVVSALGSVAGVMEADVSLYRAQATITHGPLCEIADLIQAVRQAGYGASLTGRPSGGDSEAVQEPAKH